MRCAVAFSIISATLATAPSVASAQASADHAPDKTRGQAVTRSLLLPGLGQFYKQQPTKGAVFLGAATATAGLAIIGQTQRSSRLDDYEQARDAYRAAVTAADIARTRAVAQDRADSLRRAENVRDAGLYALLGVYVLNVVDAALGFPLDGKGVSMRAAAPIDGEARLAICIARR